jgi:hypothetical protein
MRIAPFVLLVAGVASAYARPTAKKKQPAINMPNGWQWPPSKSMREQAKACEDKLDELGVAWQPAKQEGHMVDAVALVDHTIDGIVMINAFGSAHGAPAPVMDCQLALAFAKLAPRLYEVGVREVRFGSIYRWSKVRAFGKTKNALSRHALGLAMDVVSFVDDAGREAVVARDYKADDELLLAVEHIINDSGLFRIVLTPRNDPQSHKDHFHLEANPDFDVRVDGRPNS